MEKNHINPNFKALGLGFISGMRSMSAPALTSHFLTQVPAQRLENSPWRFMQSPAVALGLKVLAATEIVGDKIPGAPDRISPPVLLSRVAAGALVGVTCNQANNKSEWVGAILGGAGALVASYAFYYLRKNFARKTGLPDWVGAIIEDTLVLSAGITLAKAPPTHNS